MELLEIQFCQVSVNKILFLIQRLFNFCATIYPSETVMGSYERQLSTNFLHENRYLISSCENYEPRWRSFFKVSILTIQICQWYSRDTSYKYKPSLSTYVETSFLDCLQLCFKTLDVLVSYREVNNQTWTPIVPILLPFSCGHSVCHFKTNLYKFKGIDPSNLPEALIGAFKRVSTLSNFSC